MPSNTGPQHQRREELNKIRNLPIPISQKRALKAMLKELPVVEVKGIQRFLWCFRSLQSILRRWKRQWRNRGIWQRSLQEIEVRGGTSIVNVFLFIKWTVYFNLIISLIVLGFVILPYLTVPREMPGVSDSCPANYSPPGNFASIANADSSLTTTQLSECCVIEYYRVNEQTMETNLWNAWGNAQLWDRNVFSFSPMLYGFYSQYNFSATPGVGYTYDFKLAYVLVPVGVIILSLMGMVYQIGVGIKQVTLNKEGEFYKFSNLVFAGWDHYTRDEKGAKFKKQILLNEIFVAFSNDSRKATTRRPLSKKQQVRLYIKRVVANVLVVLGIFILGYGIFSTVGFSIRNSCTRTECDLEPFRSRPQVVNILVGYLPAVVINLSNIIYPVFLKRVIRKLERYSRDVQIGLTLIRALVVRVLSIAFVAVRIYLEEYCEKAPNTCVVCAITDLGVKDACWESLLGMEIYVIVVIDLIIKALIVLVFGFGKQLLGKLTKIRCLMSVTKFNIIRHSLDVIYIQSLSWFFYFAPFLPVVVTIYCVIMAHLKKLNLMYLSQAAPDTFRTARSTTIYVATKLLAFVAVSLTIGFVLRSLEPSRSCGPFRGLAVPWDVIAANQSYVALRITSIIASPGVSVPIVVIMITLSYYYYTTSQTHLRIVNTLRHILILEGHDKQYLFQNLDQVKTEAKAQGLLATSSLDVRESREYSNLSTPVG